MKTANMSPENVTRFKHLARTVTYPNYFMKKLTAG